MALSTFLKRHFSPARFGDSNAAKSNAYNAHLQARLNTNIYEIKLCLRWGYISYLLRFATIDTESATCCKTIFRAANKTCNSRKANDHEHSNWQCTLFLGCRIRK
jgi:hypothetical protein